MQFCNSRQAGVEFPYLLGLGLPKQNLDQFSIGKTAKYILVHRGSVVENGGSTAEGDHAVEVGFQGEDVELF